MKSKRKKRRKEQRSNNELKLLKRSDSSKLKAWYQKILIITRCPVIVHNKFFTKIPKKIMKRMKSTSQNTTESTFVASIEKKKIQKPPQAKTVLYNSVKVSYHSKLRPSLVLSLSTMKRAKHHMKPNDNSQPKLYPFLTSINVRNLKMTPFGIK